MPDLTPDAISYEQVMLLRQLTHVYVAKASQREQGRAALSDLFAIEDKLENWLDNWRAALLGGDLLKTPSEPPPPFLRPQSAPPLGAWGDEEPLPEDEAPGETRATFPPDPLFGEYQSLDNEDEPRERG